MRHRPRSPLLPPRPRRDRSPLDPPAAARHPRPTTQAAREEQQTIAGAHLRPSFSHLIDLAEPGMGRPHAAKKAREIQAMIDQGGWTETEANQLYQARDLWRRRANGQDARYILAHGNRRGRLPRALEAEIRTFQTILDLGDAFQRLREIYR